MPELHFYPGVHVLVIRDGTRDIGRFEAWGGPATIGSDPAMAEEPTWPGEYVIGQAQAYRTPTWRLSMLKWGTQLRDMPKLNDVWYRLPSGQWASVLRDLGISRDELANLYRDLYGVKRVPATWVFNDFGPVAVRWFKDVNGNKVLDGAERLSGQMFHTTPVDEANHSRGIPVKLVGSHGCIHLKPADRDRIFGLGGFQPKTRFVVHSYDAKP